MSATRCYECRLGEHDTYLQEGETRTFQYRVSERETGAIVKKRIYLCRRHIQVFHDNYGYTCTRLA